MIKMFLKGVFAVSIVLVAGGIVCLATGVVPVTTLTVGTVGGLFLLGVVASIPLDENPRPDQINNTTSASLKKKNLTGELRSPWQSTVSGISGLFTFLGGFGLVTGIIPLTAVTGAVVVGLLLVTVATGIWGEELRKPPAHNLIQTQDERYYSSSLSLTKNNFTGSSQPLLKSNKEEPRITRRLSV